MKISIGDMIDRYTICKLKMDRGGVDCAEEIAALLAELINYNNYETYIESLQSLNGQIWDLESAIAITNKKEYIAELAIEIRRVNTLRVKVKNEINAIFNEGYNEVKVFHKSEDYKSVVITLTTVPERMNSGTIELAIVSLCEQSDSDYEVHLNIPYVYNVTNEQYVIPDWLNQLRNRYSHLRVFRTDDFGPPTKIVPTLKRISNLETIIIVVDDDNTYNCDMVREHRKYQSIISDSALCYHGKTDISRGYENPNEICVTEVSRVSYLLHYMSASYKRKLFGDDFFNSYVGKTFSDDILVSRYLTDSGVAIYVIPYEKDIHLYETYDLWKENAASNTFPIVSYIDTLKNTGCTHPNMLSIQQRFYLPPDLGKRNIILI